MDWNSFIDDVKLHKQYLQAGSFGDDVVPLDGINKTEISLNIGLFDAIVVRKRKEKTISLSARIVPNDSFVQRYGAKAALLVETYLHDVGRTDEQVPYTGIVTLVKLPEARYLGRKKENIHLGWFYNLLQRTSPEAIRHMEQDLQLDAKEAFKGMTTQALKKILQLGVDANVFSLDDVVGVEADGWVYGSPETEYGADRVPLALYYERIGFVADYPLVDATGQYLQVYEEIRMTGIVNTILSKI